MFKKEITELNDILEKVNDSLKTTHSLVFHLDSYLKFKCPPLVQSADLTNQFDEIKQRSSFLSVALRILSVEIDNKLNEKENK
jgi:hypothetical protein